MLFDEITAKTRRYAIVDSQWFPSTETSSIVAATATIAVSRQDKETVVLKGEMDGRYNLVCDRCGEVFEKRLLSEFSYLVTTRQEDDFESVEQECSDEDALTLYLAEPVIEVEEILREQALLAVPVKNVCSEECRGICAGCGVVLSRETCRCNPSDGASPFAVLKKLKNQ
ncbi:MAG: DUF177 domain-containing protein [Desulforhopalus sp.]|nr:DUF177 domain-containing protein [Desulforhopalus sp.]